LTLLNADKNPALKDRRRIDPIFAIGAYPQSILGIIGEFSI